MTPTRAGNKLEHGSSTHQGGQSSLPKTPLMGHTHRSAVSRSEVSKPTFKAFIKKPLWTIIDQPDNTLSARCSSEKSLIEVVQNLSCRSLSASSFENRDLLRHQDSNYDSCSNPEDACLLEPCDGLVLTGSHDQNDVSHKHGELHRHLTLFDLVCVGVGSTIGSGIFVLCGLIANQYAGPATFVSWGIAGGAACLSGVCYAELAGKIPTAGSVYAYSYVSMGELPAVLAAACLTLEYVGSASAVARSWGDKVVEYVQQEFLLDSGSTVWWWVMKHVLDPGYGINPMAFLVSTASVILLLQGVKESKAATNFFTTVNVSLVTFMGLGGLVLLQRQNLIPLVPPQFGLAGVFRGATSSFFGYIGYDEICCIAGEAINPRRNLPRAILMTLGIVTFLYMVAALALTGMQPYTSISRTSGFPNAFRWNGVEWAAQLTAVRKFYFLSFTCFILILHFSYLTQAGEIFALPSVVFITIMAQPRLTYALSRDGLLPKFFSKVDQFGNLRNGALVSGGIMIIISTFVPFVYLDDLISSGILVAFSMTNWSLIALRYDPPPEHPQWLNQQLAVFNILSFITGLLVTHIGFQYSLGITCIGLCCTLLAFIIHNIPKTCEPSKSFGGSTPFGRLYSAGNLRSLNTSSGYFETPFVPYLPGLGMFLNWYLITQMEWFGVCLLLFYLSLFTVLYFSYGARYSVGNTTGWVR